MVTTDALHHRITVNDRSVELQPLSYQLFVALFQQQNEVVSAAALTAAVWGNVAVAPDTLKQRVFLLRKALEDAGVDGCKLQSVRGRGYRLLVDENHDNEKARSFGVPLLVAGAIILLVLLLSYWQSRKTYEIPANNRIVFWSEVQDASEAGVYREWEQRWISKLSTGNGMMLVASNRDPGQSLSAQARQTRSALISWWTAHELDGRARLRMQIIEPRTAGILLSTEVAIDDRQQVTAAIEQQHGAIARLLGSGVLPLDQDALVDTEHPAWQTLRQLTTDPG